MDSIQSIILGAVQGLTEFIPVSSSGHLVLFGNALDISSNAHLYIQALDFGTLAALIIFFRGRIATLLQQIFDKKDFRLLVNIIMTCLPVFTLGYLASKFIESSGWFVSSFVVASSLIIVGIIMFVLERLPRAKSVATLEKLSPLRALIIGIAQCFALIPGVSRSGSTIIAGRLTGFTPKLAAEYSFLVSIPVMLALIAKLILKNGDFLIANWSSLLLGNIVAFMCGIVAVKFLLSYLGKHSLKLFGGYRIILGAMVLAILVIPTLL